MSLFRTETCFVPAAALDEAAALGAAALGAALGALVAAGDELQAATARARTLSSVSATRDTGLVPMVSTESILLLV
jgi:hypothetical protein